MSPAERKAHVGRRKKLYETRFPETRAGKAPGKAGGGKKAKNARIASFVDDTAFAEKAKAGVEVSAKPSRHGDEDKPTTTRRTRKKPEECRLERFENAIHIVLSNCEIAVDISIPDITPAQADTAIKKLGEAKVAIAKLERRIRQQAAQAKADRAATKPATPKHEASIQAAYDRTEARSKTTTPDDFPDLLPFLDRRKLN